MPEMMGSVPYLLFKMYLTQNLGLKSTEGAASDSIEVLDEPYPTDQPERTDGSRKGVALMESDSWRDSDW